MGYRVREEGEKRGIQNDNSSNINDISSLRIVKYLFTQ